MNQRRLSKSKIMAGLQCRKRLWLEVHKPELAEISAATEQLFLGGHFVGAAAQGLHPGGIQIETEGDLAEALRQTRQLLLASPESTLFEATFQHAGVLVRADIFSTKSGIRRLVEVKSATTLKDNYVPDAAVQHWVLKGAGFAPDTVELAHIDNSFVYSGGNDYQGLFRHCDLMEQVRGMEAEVEGWVEDFKRVLGGDEPKIEVGSQCAQPYPCPFLSHCNPAASQTEYPVSILPRGSRVAASLASEGYNDLRGVPEGRLDNPTHERIRQATVTGQAELDPAAAAFMRGHSYPRYFLDFETIQFAVPVWKGTRPYQQIPYQWSCHIEAAHGGIEHREYLDTTGEDPSRGLAESLIEAVGNTGPIFVYGAFEGGQIRGLIDRFPDLACELEAVLGRLVDLIPRAREYYYHPGMKGSWSLKRVLPTIAPQLKYDALEVQDGGMAGLAYLEAIHPETTIEKREAIRQALLEYCARDTEGLVLITRHFEGKAVPFGTSPEQAEVSR